MLYMLLRCSVEVDTKGSTIDSVTLGTLSATVLLEGTADCTAHCVNILINSPGLRGCALVDDPGKDSEYA